VSQVLFDILDLDLLEPDGGFALQERRPGGLALELREDFSVDRIEFGVTRLGVGQGPLGGSEGVLEFGFGRLQRAMLGCERAVFLDRVTQALLGLFELRAGAGEAGIERLGFARGEGQLGIEVGAFTFLARECAFERGDRDLARGILGLEPRAR